MGLELLVAAPIYDGRSHFVTRKADFAALPTWFRGLTVGPRSHTPIAMLDLPLRRQLAVPLAPAVDQLQRWKIPPMALTILAFAAAVAAMISIGYHRYLPGLGLLILAGLFDVLDGPLARRESETSGGVFLDKFLSIVAAAGIPFAFALAQPDRALAAMFLLLGLVARTAADDVRAIGKTEIFVAFALACLFPDWFSIIAYTVGILCFVSAGMRLAAVMARRA
jgi:phosphatidylglycerophosphate synthase